MFRRALAPRVVVQPPWLVLASCAECALAVALAAAEQARVDGGVVWWRWWWRAGGGGVRAAARVRRRAAPAAAAAAVLQVVPVPPEQRADCGDGHEGVERGYGEEGDLLDVGGVGAEA